jgi:hypothetical protein
MREDSPIKKNSVRRNNSARRLVRILNRMRVAATSSKSIGDALCAAAGIKTTGLDENRKLLILFQTACWMQELIVEVEALFEGQSESVEYRSVIQNLRNAFAPGSLGQPFQNAASQIYVHGQILSLELLSQSHDHEEDQLDDAEVTKLLDSISLLLVRVRDSALPAAYKSICEIALHSLKQALVTYCFFGLKVANKAIYEIEGLAHQPSSILSKEALTNMGDDEKALIREISSTYEKFVHICHDVYYVGGAIGVVTVAGAKLLALA